MKIENGIKYYRPTEVADMKMLKSRRGGMIGSVRQVYRLRDEMLLVFENKFVSETEIKRYNKSKKA